MKKRNFFVCVTVWMPLLVSLAAMLMKNYIAGILASFLVFIFVAVCPYCRKRESMWIFVLTAVNTLPVNIAISAYFVKYAKYSLSLGNLGIGIGSIFVFIVLFSLEELIIGLVGRLIWRQQYLLKF